MRSSLNLDKDHNDAIRAEMGERFRIVLSGDQSELPPRIQHLLNRLSELETEHSPSIVPSAAPSKMKPSEGRRR
jgi:hypothetical protein